MICEPFLEPLLIQLTSALINALLGHNELKEAIKEFKDIDNI